MAWVLEICTLDVGRGESALIIAIDAATGQSKTMLIDGGRTNNAATVHAYVQARLALHGLNRLNHIVTSHYDVDHSEGITQLIASDNLDANAEVIGNAAGAAAFAAAGLPPNNQIAAASAAAVATAVGCYGSPAAAGIAVDAGATASALPVGGRTPFQAASDGVRSGLLTVEAEMQNIPIGRDNVVATARRNNTARRAGIAAANAGGLVAARSTAAKTAAFNAMRAGARPVGLFETNGLYRNVNVSDTGNANATENYELCVINQRILFNGQPSVPVVGLMRTRNSLLSAQLGQEILWRYPQPPGGAPPANAPVAFLVASNRFTWNRPANQGPINISEENNSDSLAFVFKFGNFWFYTGGDLPTQGEVQIGTAVMGQGLPNPWGGGVNLPTPACINMIKCGHHGANTSTSAAFLAIVQPRVALISCGSQYDHPAQVTINNLLAAPMLRRVCLTNCIPIRVGVPGSNGVNQMAAPHATIARVCGDNLPGNAAAPGHVVRGNITMTVTEAAANGPPHARQINVSYWNTNPPVALNENINFS